MWWGRTEKILKKYGAAFEGAPVPDKPCRGQHQEHVCAMAARADFQKVAKVAGQPKHVCMNCGRVADAADNLCNPLPMSAMNIGLPHPA